MSLIKGRVSDISDDFLERMERAFPEANLHYHPASQQSHADLAYFAGQRYIIEWIKKHAVKTTSTG